MYRIISMVFFLLFNNSLLAQENDRTKILQAARDIMVSARFCTLVTIDKSGFPQVRVMDPFPPTISFRVWMATHVETRKTEQIKKNSKVAINYFDKDGVGSVTLIGTAALVDDKEKKNKLWKDDWAAFYSDLNQGDDYILIEVEPVSLEVVSFKHKIASEPDSWKPAIVTFPK